MYCNKDQRYWDEVLLQVMMVYRVFVYFSISLFLNMMMLGRNIMMLIEVIILRFKYEDEYVLELEEYVCILQEKLIRVYEIVRKYIK